MDLAKVDLVKIREKSGFSEHVCETPPPPRDTWVNFENLVIKTDIQEKVGNKPYDPL